MNNDRRQSDRRHGGWKSMAALATGLISMWAAREVHLSNQAQLYQEKLIECRDEYARASIEGIALSYEIKSKLNREEVLERYIDGLPFPAWIKHQGKDGKIRMLMINRSYEDVFGVSKARYIGATDYDIWPKEIAALYEYHDREVMKYKRYQRSKETIIVNNKEREVIVWKFSIELNDGQYGIGGVIVEVER